MPLLFHDLTEATRTYMAAEFDADVAGGVLYLSRYLSDQGRASYPELLGEAISDGTDETLALSLSTPGLFLDHHQKRTPSGGTTLARVPRTAPVTLAEGEFNRFYLRGLCRRAIDEDNTAIEVYRARESAVPRAESQAMIGARFDPERLLFDLRANVGVDLALKLPPGPNSGLSGRIVPV